MAEKNTHIFHNMQLKSKCGLLIQIFKTKSFLFHKQTNVVNNKTSVNIFVYESYTADSIPKELLLKKMTQNTLQEPLPYYDKQLCISKNQQADLNKLWENGIISTQYYSEFFKLISNIDVAHCLDDTDIEDEDTIE